MGKTGEIEEGILVELMNVVGYDLHDLEVLGHDFIKILSMGFILGTYYEMMEANVNKETLERFGKKFIGGFILSCKEKPVPGFENGMSKEQCEGFLKFMSDTIVHYKNILESSEELTFHKALIELSRK